MRTAQVITATLVAILTCSSLHALYGHGRNSWHHRHAGYYYDDCDRYDDHDRYHRRQGREEEQRTTDSTFRFQ